MDANDKRPTVILRRCDAYSVDTLSAIVRESMADLGLHARGRVFIKPNVVTANRRYIHHSFTDPAVVEAMVGVVRESAHDDLCIGESGGYGIPTRMFLRESGYHAMARRLGVRLVDLNEHGLVKVALHKAAWHREILLSRFIHEADFRIWMPKLKFHVFAGITNALKLNVGILTHGERMLFHDHRIHEKIVDLLEPGYPDLVVTDAVNVTYGFESAPYPTPLGLIMVSNHPLATDAVAAHIMGYDPRELAHLRIASERGYGSLDLDDIDICGDHDLEELRRHPKGDTRLFQHLAELDTPIRFFAGPAPDTDVPCDGGCECALKGCLGTIEKRSPGALKGARPGAIVTGVYAGDVVQPDGPVLLVGDCARVTGNLQARKVRRVKGCPMGARNLFIKVPRLFGMPSPMLDPRDAILFIHHSIMKYLRIGFTRLFTRR